MIIERAEARNEMAPSGMIGWVKTSSGRPLSRVLNGRRAPAIFIARRAPATTAAEHDLLRVQRPEGQSLRDLPAQHVADPDLWPWSGSSTSISATPPKAALRRDGQQGPDRLHVELGDVVNLAARLCSQAAAGQTLVSGSTHPALAGSAGPLQPLGVRGKRARRSRASSCGARACAAAGRRRLSTGTIARRRRRRRP